MIIVDYGFASDCEPEDTPWFSSTEGGIGEHAQPTRTAVSNTAFKKYLRTYPAVAVEYAGNVAGTFFHSDQCL